MKRFARGLIAIALAMLAVPATAQVGAADSESFIESVRDGDNQTALTLLESRPGLLNAQNRRGETALLVALKNRDTDWTAHLLRAGADPNLPARNGETPLIAAARSNFFEAVNWLLGVGAKVDGANKMGETALIVAVQRRDLPLVKLLMSNGADPDRTDSAAGYSARDYAKRDTRSPEILATINATRPAAKGKPAPDDLDSFKLD